MAKEYVLGTGLDELERLAFQHRLWSDAAHTAWMKAGIRIGQRILDVGCGPGFAAFDLAQLVTRAGNVTGIDESPVFVDYLNQQAALRGLPQLSGLAGDVQDLAAVLDRADPFDLAWIRWVLCFVPRPGDVLAGISELLRPGGRIVIHDYFGYRSLQTAPGSVHHDRAVAATIESWHARGGNTDVAGELPRLLEETGFQLQHFQAHARVARSCDTMFQWADVWWKTYAPKLVDMGHLQQQDCDGLLEHMQSLRRSEQGFIQCPIVYELVAVKI